MHQLCEYSIASLIFSANTTSGEIKRKASTVGIFYSPGRNRFKPETVKQMIFLHGCYISDRPPSNRAIVKIKKNWRIYHTSKDQLSRGSKIQYCKFFKGDGLQFSMFLIKACNGLITKMSMKQKAKMKRRKIIMIILI